MRAIEYYLHDRDDVMKFSQSRYVMKLGKLERLMLELALKVQPTELYELVFSCSQLTEAQKSEAHTPIKLLVALKKISGTNEHFLEALERLFEEISHFEELLEMVRAFRRENPHLNRSSSFGSTTPNLPNGVFAFRPEENQQLRFQKMLLNVSNHTDWIHLEIMVALSPIPDGLKESISKGFELFDRLKQHGCISENDTELLDEFFSSLNLQKPMQLLRTYQQQFPQVIFEDPPANAPFRAVPTPPLNLQSHSSHNNSSMHSQPSYRSQFGESETQLRQTSSLSSPASLSAYRSNFSSLSSTTSSVSHGHVSLWEQSAEERKQISLGNEPVVVGNQNASHSYFASHLPTQESSGIYPQPSQPTASLPKSPDEDIYPGGPIPCTSIRPSDELYPTTRSLNERKRKQRSGMSEVTITAPEHPPDAQPPQPKRFQQDFQPYSPGTSLSSLSSTASSASHGHVHLWDQSAEERKQISLGNEPVVVGNQNASHSYFASHLPTQESNSTPPSAKSSTHGAPETSASQNLNPQQCLSHEPPSIQIHTQESGTEASNERVPGGRPSPSSNQEHTVLRKYEAWRAAGQQGEPPQSINLPVTKEPTTSMSAPYKHHTSHSTASAGPHYEHPSHLSSAMGEYATAQQVSPNQGHSGRIVSPNYSGPVKQHCERSPTYITNLSCSSLESGMSNLSSTSAGTNTLLSNLSSGGATMESSEGSTLPSQSSFGTSIGSSSSPSRTRRGQASNRSSSEGYRPSNREGEPNLAASGEEIREEEGGGEKQRSWIVRTVSGLLSKFTGSGKKDTADASSDEYESCDEDPSTGDF